MINNRKVIGIIGGMGPLATADLFKKIVDKTDAKCDGEHLHILIDNNTDIPDRTACILAGSDEPAKYMLESALRLESMGADVLLIPCNTAHYYLPYLAEGCRIPVMSMPGLTAFTARDMGLRCVGLLATDGTVRSGVYDKPFALQGIKLIKPDEEGQKKVMHLIYDEVKAGKPADISALDATLDAMEKQGCEAFILGCTELPIAFAGDASRRYLDPTSILAQAAIKIAGGKVRTEVTV